MKTIYLLDCFDFIAKFNMIDNTQGFCQWRQVSDNSDLFLIDFEYKRWFKFYMTHVTVARHIHVGDQNWKVNFLDEQRQISCAFVKLVVA